MAKVIIQGNLNRVKYKYKVQCSDCGSVILLESDDMKHRIDQRDHDSWHEWTCPVCKRYHQITQSQWHPDKLTPTDEDLALVEDDQPAQPKHTIKQTLDEFTYDGKTYTIQPNYNGRECVMLDGNRKCLIESHLYNAHCTVDCKRYHLEPKD